MANHYRYRYNDIKKTYNPYWNSRAPEPYKPDLPETKERTLGDVLEEAHKALESVDELEPMATSWDETTGVTEFPSAQGVTPNITGTELQRRLTELQRRLEDARQHARQQQSPNASKAIEEYRAGLIDSREVQMRLHNLRQRRLQSVSQIDGVTTRTYTNGTVDWERINQITAQPGRVIQHRTPDTQFQQNPMMRMAMRNSQWFGQPLPEPESPSTLSMLLTWLKFAKKIWRKSR